MARSDCSYAVWLEEAPVFLQESVSKYVIISFYQNKLMHPSTLGPSFVVACGPCISIFDAIFAHSTTILPEFDLQ